MKFNSKFLPRNDTVFTVMFLDKALCEKTLEMIMGEKIDLVNIVAEFKNDLRLAALNSIFFDIKTRSTDGRIITLDLQRQYSKERIRNRTVYYACREVSIQMVKDSAYENLKNVAVTFILTQAPLLHTSENSEIMLIDKKTHEIYTELMKIYEVNIKHISDLSSVNMRILKAFFEIENEDMFNLFVQNYKENEYAEMLLINYEKAIDGENILYQLG